MDNKNKLKDVIMWGILFVIVIIASILSMIYFSTKDKENKLDESDKATIETTVENSITTEESTIDSNSTDVDVNINASTKEEATVKDETTDNNVDSNVTTEYDNVDEQIYSGEDNQ